MSQAMSWRYVMALCRSGMSWHYIMTLCHGPKRFKFYSPPRGWITNFEFLTSHLNIRLWPLIGWLHVFVLLCLFFCLLCFAFAFCCFCFFNQGPTGLNWARSHSLVGYMCLFCCVFCCFCCFCFFNQAGLMPAAIPFSMRFIDSWVSFDGCPSRKHLMCIGFWYPTPANLLSSTSISSRWKSDNSLG